MNFNGIEYVLNKFTNRVVYDFFLKGSFPEIPLLPDKTLSLEVFYKKFPKNEREENEPIMARVYHLVEDLYKVEHLKVMVYIPKNNSEKRKLSKIVKKVKESNN